MAGLWIEVVPIAKQSLHNQAAWIYVGSFVPWLHVLINLIAELVLPKPHRCHAVLALLPTSRLVKTSSIVCSC